MNINYNKSIVPLFISLIMLGGILSGCRDCKKGKCGDSDTIKKDSIKLVKEYTYNFYIENSGSMKGYFSGNGSSDLETIIQEYYDRITEIANREVSLNFINIGKVKFDKGISDYLSEAKGKCTAAFTKIADILKMSMDDVNDNTVNIVISDFGFASNNGNLKTEQSKITKLFTSQLDSNPNISIAIIKYVVGFNGLYYPGGIPCNKKMPIYFWVFGNAEAVKESIKLNIKESSEGELYLQPEQEIKCSIEINSKRAVDKDTKNCIIVKKWDKDKRDNRFKADAHASLTNVILNEDEIKKADSYKLECTSSSNYVIDSIDNNGDEYIFHLSCDKPSPGELIVNLPLNRPLWIDDSNFEETGIPDEGKTYGIKYLIDGVFDAYSNLNNKKNNYFYFKITLE